MRWGFLENLKGHITQQVHITVLLVVPKPLINRKHQKDAVEWAWPQEMGDNMFAVVNTYTRAAPMEGLPAESSYRLQKVGGEVLGMLN